MIKFLALSLAVITAFSFHITACASKKQLYEQVMSAESDQETFEQFSDELKNISEETGCLISTLNSYLMQ